ncbi:hypothetical protein FQA39_LY08404 [Lamprigera yunnana]|nr:hypothetical protein FQA39_LY08404 [Lamprigera yunnana]
MEKTHAHYSERKKILLATLVRDHGVIEDKMTDVVTVHNKRAEWELLTKEYNSQPETDIHRTFTHMKTWKNLEQKKRNQTTMAVNLSLKTGGGPLPKLKEDLVLEIIGDSAPYMDVVITNDYDSTASLCNPPPDMTNVESIATVGKNLQTSQEFITAPRGIKRHTEATTSAPTKSITAISHNQNKTEGNTEIYLRVKRIRNLMEGDEELKEIRLETALIKKEKALEKLQKARYETKLTKLKLENYIKNK